MASPNAAGAPSAGGVPRSWTRTDDDGRVVRIAIRVPPGRRAGVAVWAVATATLSTLLAALLLVFVVAVASAQLAAPPDRPEPGDPTLVLVLAGLCVAVLAWRLPGAWRLAAWRLAGREAVEIAGGRVRVVRWPCGGEAAADLDVSGGAFVGVVGDVDRFLVRATRWRRGRRFRRDDVPGLDVGSVRIATADASVHTGLSLDPGEAAALAAELAELPGFSADRSPAGPGAPPRT